jgi:hypothetical protein
MTFRLKKRGNTYRLEGRYGDRGATPVSANV